MEKKCGRDQKDRADPDLKGPLFEPILGAKSVSRAPSDPKCKKSSESETTCQGLSPAESRDEGEEECDQSCDECEADLLPTSRAQSACRLSPGEFGSVVASWKSSFK